MSLTSLWKSQKGELDSKHIQAMVGLAGDGRLRDGSKSKFKTDCIEARLVRLETTDFGILTMLRPSSWKSRPLRFTQLISKRWRTTARSLRVKRRSSWRNLPS